MFNNLSDRLSDSFKRLRSRGILTEGDVDETVSEIRRALLDADVALPVVRSFVKTVRQKAYGAARSKALNPGQQVIKIVHDELVEILGGDTRELKYAKRGPSIFMLAGLQGAGKTTLAGKLANWLRSEENKRVLLVACDLQRPNAVTQLQVMGERAQVDVWAPEPGNGVGDPVTVARSGVNEAITNGYDVVIVDTAGRLGIDEEMMTQACNIRDAIDPHEIIFVLDAMVGQDAVQTSLAFRDGVGFTGVVVSKLDGDARGGAALSVRGVTGQPILFASTGENIKDFERFHADRMAGRILDMGDMLTLIEQAQKAYDEQEAQALAKKMQAGEFTLNDFMQQLRQIRKLGSMKKLMGMLPGMNQFRDQLDQFDEKSLDRIEAIVNSMTPAERADLKLLNGSRRARIARGSGTSVNEINQLVERFQMAAKMMKKMSGGGGMPSLPGMGNMPGMPGMGGGSKKLKAKGKKAKRKFGSPAKQKAWEAAQEAKRNQPSTEAPKTDTGSAFGVPTPTPQAPLGSNTAKEPDMPMPTLDDLPDDLKRLLGR